jgi:hypothetical protein
MRRFTAKFVPRLLNNELRDQQVQVCTELQDTVRHGPNFLSRLIIGDESWLYNYDPETKQQSLQRKTQSSLRMKKAHNVRSNIKSKLKIYFTLEKLCIRKRHKRPEKWKIGD